MGFTSFNTAHSSEPKDFAIDAMQTLAPRLEAILLPPIQSEAFVSQRHEVNPALALNVLKDIHAKVSTWQQQLRQIVQAMRALYEQGPMVDGWLQSSAQVPAAHLAPKAESSDHAVLRHGDADALMQYVDALERTHTAVTEADSLSANRSPSNSLSTNPGSAHHYHLCSLTAEGIVRSQPCPPAQMAMVSTAIARYQKFKQLASQKQTIETKLQQAVDSLTAVRAHL